MSRETVEYFNILMEDHKKCDEVCSGNSTTKTKDGS